MEQFLINVNGYDTFYIDSQDSIGRHLLIAIPPYAEKDISDICGTFVNGHLITQIDYQNTDSVKYIKAYY